MPGWAGSSWYFFRYMEEKANRDQAFASEEALNYWENVDLYIGGSEHATGHLLYSRFWVKFLKDRGFVSVEEPFKKLINQGMILGTSAFVYEALLNNKSLNIYITSSFFQGPDYSSSENPLWSDKIMMLKSQGYREGKIKEIKYRPIHVDVSFVNSSDELDIEAFKNWRAEYKDC